MMVELKSFVGAVFNAVFFLKTSRVISWLE